MIPKQAIEKAKEGGWENNLPSAVAKTVDDHKEQYHAGVLTKLMWHQFWPFAACDPTFWQALEVALRVPCGEHTKRGYCVNCDGKGYHRPQGLGSMIGERFCHLILTNQPTEKFWEEILK